MLKRMLAGAHRGARARIVAMSLCLTALTIGCSDLLNVENEQDILDVDLTNPGAVDPLVAGVAGDFAVAYTDAVNITGLFSSELIHTGSFPTWREVETGFGRRPSGPGNGMYNNLSRAIWVADDATRRIREVLDDHASRPEVAQALIWGAFARLILADNYCEATIAAGPAIPPSEVYQQAEDHFTEAITIAIAANDPDIRNRARAGRARARLMLGDLTGARDDAAEIPTGFDFMVQYSDNSGRENNSVATNTTTTIRREAGVHPRFYEDERYSDDPRTSFIDGGPSETGADPTRQFVEQLKYPVRSSPIPMITWQEARLIEAEAQVGLEELDLAVELIDEVRAASELPAYTGAVTEEAVLDQLFFERSAELWLQAQHLNDLRRSNDPYMETRLDSCFEIGQREWETNPNLGG